MKPDAVKKGGKVSAKNAASPARRTGRITEKEEDDLLLQEAKTDAPAVQLTATPPCTCSLLYRCALSRAFLSRIVLGMKLT